jgi:hypothetical protein
MRGTIGQGSRRNGTIRRIGSGAENRADRGAAQGESLRRALIQVAKDHAKLVLILAHRASAVGNYISSRSVDSLIVYVPTLIAGGKPNMKFKQAIAAIEKFAPAAKFQHSVHYRREPFKSYFREYFPSRDLKDSCGVYLVLSPDDDVLYVGKAAARNLFRETYAKFGTPNPPGPLFPNHCWTERTLPVPIKGVIEAGEFQLGFIVLESADAATDVESYLQKLAVESDGRLPPLNLRIG